MPNVNKAIVMGVLGRNPETKNFRHYVAPAQNKCLKIAVRLPFFTKPKFYQSLSLACLFHIMPQ